MIVETIETFFEPVAIYNNVGGADQKILKQFGEPAWNYQVIRFLDANGRDIIPRKDRIWTIEALAGRLIDVLTMNGTEVPESLTKLVHSKN